RGTHVGKDGAGAQEGSGEVDVEGPLPFTQVEVFYRRDPEHSGIQYEHRRWAEFLYDLGYRTVHRSLVRHVALHAEEPVGGRPHQVETGDSRSLIGEAAADLGADAPGGARDDRHPILKPLHFHHGPWVRPT